MAKTGTNGGIREAKRLLYRNLILDSAEGVFAEQGYDATKVQQIAAAAGVSLATLYKVFPTKLALLSQLHRRRLDSLLELIDPVRLSPDPLEQLSLAYKTYLTFHMANPNYLRMHLCEGNAWALTDELRTPEQTMAWQRGLEAATAQIKMGIERGDFIDDDPELLARTVIAMHQVRLGLWIRGGMKQPVEEVVRQADRQLIGFLCTPRRARTLLKETAPRRPRKSRAKAPSEAPSTLP